jgi:hypothetical protein
MSIEPASISREPVGLYSRVDVEHTGTAEPCILFIHNSIITGVAERTLEFGSTHWLGYVQKSLSGSSQIALAPKRKYP